MSDQNQTAMHYENVVIMDPLDLIKDFTVSVRSDSSIVWRGQRASTWRLIPSLFRLERGSNEWQSIEFYLMRNFEKSSTR
jgi:hypothetical protein